MYVAAHSRSLRCANLVVYHEVFERDAGYREDIERNIRRFTGVGVDLSDYQTSRPDHLTGVSAQEAIQVAD
jgi:hypothetical protein